MNEPGSEMRTAAGPAPTSAASNTAWASEPRVGALVAGLALWLGVTVVVSSLVAPFAFRAIEAISPGAFPFDRVFRRVAMLVALVHLVVWLRQSGVRRWADAGFTGAGRRSGAFPRWALAGALLAAALFVVDVVSGHRVAALALTPAGVAKALLGGALIGLLEEGVCRGALVFPFGRLRGAALALAAGAISAVYSTGHFARGRTRLAEVDWTSGFELWGRVGDAIAASPEAWVGLFALGLLFDRLARRQGHVWGAAGLHAGAVAVIQLGSDLTDPAPAGSLFFTNGLHPAWALTALLAVGWLLLAREPKRSDDAPGT
ncbi:MAG: hypothetical protein AMXMBFR36_16400 [Acidobacteriota bacterium]